MNVTKLVLHNYVRFSLNKITNLVYTPNKNMQIILGQNGSGKSSLLEQLLPVCNNAKKDFNTDGYRELHFTHNDRDYVLHNTQTGKHSFLIDSEEFNPGGTRAVQNQLIKDHTGVTPNIQKVLLGGKQFTTMSPMERKEWITEMSSIDYTFPVSVYNKLRTEHRDIVGGIKLLQANITRATQTMLAEELVTKLELDRTYTNSLIDHLLRLIGTVSDGIGTSSATNEVRIAYTKLTKQLRGITTKSLTGLKEEYIQCESDIKNLDTALAKMVTELDIIKSTVDDSRLPKLKKARHVVKDELDHILDTNRYGGLEDRQTTVSYLLNNYTNIVSKISDITDCGNIDYSKDRLNKLLSCRDEVANTIAIVTKVVNTMSAELKHISKHHGVGIKCPECANEWTPSSSDNDYSTIEIAISKRAAQLNSKNKELSVLDADIKAVAMTRGLLGELAGLFSMGSGTKKIMSDMLQSDTFQSDGVGALFNLFEMVMVDIRELASSDKLLDQITELDSEIDKTTALATMATDLRTNQIDKLTNEISNTVVEKRRVKDLLNSLARDISTVSGITELRANLARLVKQAYYSRDKSVTAIRNHHLEQAVAGLRSQLMDIDDQLKDNSDRLHMLGRYQSELGVLNQREKILKTIINTLSPSGGLIAKSISSFLNIFLDDINSIIFEVWDYPMEILACDIAEDDLDYKFKVLVNNSEVVNDISSTSAGMSEIINMAFKVVFCKYMGLTNFPLILDEFGRTFDASHRVKAYDTLDRTLSGMFSQIYIVSHYESMYGRFSNADVSIMDTAGVDMSTVSNYNKVMLVE